MQKRTILLLLLACFSLTGIAQYNGFVDYLYYLHAPQVNSEGKGKIGATNNGTVLCSQTNPAGIGTLNGISAQGNYTTPFYHLKDGFMFSGGGAIGINNQFQIGFSNSHFNSGDTNYYILHNYQDTIRVKSYTMGKNIFTLSAEVFPNLFLAANAGVSYYKHDKTIYNDQKFTLDAGVLKIIEWNENRKLRLGGSYSNILNQKLTLNNGDNELPSIARGGLGYYWGSFKPESKKVQTIQIDAEAEYIYTTNSEAYTGFGGGIEFTLWETLRLRGGYRSLDFFVSPSTTQIITIGETTYGIGFSIPFQKILKTDEELKLDIDFALLPEPSITPIHKNGTYYSGMISLKYAPRIKKEEEKEEEIQPQPVTVVVPAKTPLPLIDKPEEKPAVIEEEKTEEKSDENIDLDSEKTFENKQNKEPIIDIDLN